MIGYHFPEESGLIFFFPDSCYRGLWTGTPMFHLPREKPDLGSPPSSGSNMERIEEKTLLTESQRARPGEPSAATKSSETFTEVYF